MLLAENDVRFFNFLIFQIIIFLSNTLHSAYFESDFVFLLSYILSARVEPSATIPGVQIHAKHTEKCASVVPGKQ